MQRLILVLIALAMLTSAPAYSRSIPFDVLHSTMMVYVYKQGLFSFLADNHEVNAPLLSGSFDNDAKTVDLAVDATKMHVLDPKMPANRRDAVQANMVGPEVLDVGTYPTISFHSTTIDETDPKRWTVAGTLSLHGQTHPIIVHVLRTDASHFSGTATIRQTAFGIAPIKIAGGGVSVKDDVNVEFNIGLTP
jgi:polyisoprenoid-binding protein YceI